MGGAVYLLGIPLVMAGIWLWRALGRLPDELARSLDPIWVITTMILSLFLAVFAATLIHHSWATGEAGVLAACIQSYVFPAKTRAPMPGERPKALRESGIIGRGLAAIVVPATALCHSWGAVDLSLTLLLTLASLAACKAAWTETAVKAY